MKNLIIIMILLVALAGKQATAQITDTFETRPAQLTFITPLGTNGIESPQFVNSFSINILGGYNGGVDGIELGGYVNMTRYYVRGIQMSGFANINLGHQDGVQLGGFANVNLDKTKGLQASGFANFAGETVQGVQAAGFANAALGNVNGLQAAGFANLASGNVQGAQVAGFANLATDTVDGLQLSGFANIANTVKGVQLGFINIADTVDGASIGFLSLVRQGYHAFEITGNEAGFVNASLKLGTQRFYNIFSVGMQPADIFRWGAGYGIGTSIRFSEKFSTNFDLMAYHINEGESWTRELNEFYQLKTNANYRINDFMTITAGPTFNMMISDYLGVDPQDPGSEFPPYNFYDYTTQNDYNIKMWIGINAGIRFGGK